MVPNSKHELIVKTGEYESKKIVRLVVKNKIWAILFIQFTSCCDVILKLLNFNA